MSKEIHCHAHHVYHGVLEFILVGGSWGHVGILVHLEAGYIRRSINSSELFFSTNLVRPSAIFAKNWLNTLFLTNLVKSGNTWSHGHIWCTSSKHHGGYNNGGHDILNWFTKERFPNICKCGVFGGSLSTRLILHFLIKVISDYMRLLVCGLLAAIWYNWWHFGRIFLVGFFWCGFFSLKAHE